jgi:hypothetical protein
MGRTGFCGWEAVSRSFVILIVGLYVERWRGQRALEIFLSLLKFTLKFKVLGCGVTCPAGEPTSLKTNHDERPSLEQSGITTNTMVINPTYLAQRTRQCEFRTPDICEDENANVRYSRQLGRRSTTSFEELPGMDSSCTLQLLR